MERTKKVRDLTAQQQSQVDRVFKCLATIAATRDGDPIILDRNSFVDSTIADLLDEVKGDELLLLSAFAFWIDDRDLSYVQWPVTQFQKALVGAVAATEQELAFSKRIPTHREAEQIQTARAALLKFGGAI
jgi:hypothetical protein